MDWEDVNPLSSGEDSKLQDHINVHAFRLCSSLQGNFDMPFCSYTKSNLLISTVPEERDPALLHSWTSMPSQSPDILYQLAGYNTLCHSWAWLFHNQIVFRWKPLFKSNVRKQVIPTMWINLTKNKLKDVDKNLVALRSFRTVVLLSTNCLKLNLSLWPWEK